MTNTTSSGDKRECIIRVEEVEGLRLMCHLLLATAARWNDCGSRQSAYDCDILLRKDYEIAVEITQHVNRARRAQHGHISQQYDTGKWYKQVHKLKRNWFVDLQSRYWIPEDMPGARRADLDNGIRDCVAGSREFMPDIVPAHKDRVNTLPSCVRPLKHILYELELRGVTDRMLLSAERLNPDRDTENVDWELYELGVLSCRSYAGTGKITFSETNEGTKELPCESKRECAPEDAQTPEEVVRRYAKKKERTLSAASDKQERHLLIWLDSDTTAARRMVSDVHQGLLPETVPELPDTIDVVWLAVNYTLESFPHVWRVSQSGWKLVDPSEYAYCSC